MPVPPPKKDETQSEFMSRCVPAEIGTGPDKRPQDQAVAMCLSQWRRAKGIPEPKKDDEDKSPRQEFAKTLERVAEFIEKGAT